MEVITTARLIEASIPISSDKEEKPYLIFDNLGLSTGIKDASQKGTIHLHINGLTDIDYFNKATVGSTYTIMFTDKPVDVTGMFIATTLKKSKLVESNPFSLIEVLEGEKFKFDISTSLKQLLFPLNERICVYIYKN